MALVDNVRNSPNLADTGSVVAKGTVCRVPWHQAKLYEAIFYLRFQRTKD